MVWQESVAEILLKNGAEFDTKTNLGYTPLYLAIASKTEVLIKLLLSYGADINASDIHDITPLQRSISPNFKWTEILLQNGAKIDLKDLIGNTSLHSAVFLEDKAKIEVLLRYGASLKLTNKFGYTPFEWALHNDNICSLYSLKLIFTTTNQIQVINTAITYLIFS